MTADGTVVSLMADTIAAANGERSTLFGSPSDATSDVGLGSLAVSDEADDLETSTSRGDGRFEIGLPDSE